MKSSPYRVIYTSLSSLTAIEFYRQLASDLGLEPAFRKVENYRNIQERVKKLSVDKRITPMFILDEANYISNWILNDLKMIFNFDMDSKEKAIVLLVGLPYLNNTLNLNMHDSAENKRTDIENACWHFFYVCGSLLWQVSYSLWALKNWADY